MDGGNSISPKGRRATREVRAGNTGIGGSNPIRVQSMTNTPTMETSSMVAQILRIAQAGGELARMTVQNIREAENLENIRQDLEKTGCFIPLVADIHFNPAIAEVAASIVHKVRINPGNYGTGQSRDVAGISDDHYSRELERAGIEFRKLIRICRSHNTALRIGVNHGSLSPRIISRYGNTDLGMVESAMEFLRICREENFYDVVVSLKSSNTRIMVNANRLMVEAMDREGMDYPLHLGVTEAGEGEDGRVRSVAGIGTLLSEGIGDTIRISLTEDPEEEIPVAVSLLEYIAGKESFVRHGLVPGGTGSEAVGTARISRAVATIGGEQVPVVVMEGADFEPVNGLLPDYKINAAITDPEGFHVVTASRFLAGDCDDEPCFVELSPGEISDEIISRFRDNPNAVIVFFPQSKKIYRQTWEFLSGLQSASCRNPVILKQEYSFSDAGSFMIGAAADFSPFLIDRAIDGIWIVNNKIPQVQVISTAFSILQSTRTRTTRTEFISCPSCGRTMFDIRRATAAVKEATSHLRGLKIAVMGCIVNGPGEMADADYGYVGSGRGKVTLYKKQTVVNRNIPEEKALNELIGLIKRSGDWREG